MTRIAVLDDWQGVAGQSADWSRLSQRAQLIFFEQTLGLLLAAARFIPTADASIRSGGFQSGVPAGAVLEGRTLGVIGLGKIGSRMARYGQALGMQVLAWSQNLTEDKARAA